MNVYFSQTVSMVQEVRKTEIITNVRMYKNKGTRGNLIYSVKTEIRSLATCAFYFWLKYFYTLIYLPEYYLTIDFIYKINEYGFGQQCYFQV